MMRWGSQSWLRARFPAGPAGRKAGCRQECPPHKVTLGAFALFVLIPSLVAQQQPGITLPDLLARIQARRNATDFRASGRLVSVSPTGNRRTRQITMRARAFGDIVKIFCEVTDPQPDRVRLLIESRAAGRGSVRMGHAGDRAPRELPPESWGDALLDSNFSYEDLMESHFLWHSQTLTGEAKYGARMCYVVRSEPAPADHSHYSSITSWLDTDVYYPVHVEKTIRGSGVVKEFIYYGLRESKGIWSASQIECRIRGRESSSLMIMTRGSAKAHVNASEFDPALLMR